MAADTALFSTYPSSKSCTAAGILKSSRSINRRPLTTGRSRHKSEIITTSIVRLNKHNNNIPLPVASYYYTTSTFPSLYATFSTDKLRKNSVTSNTDHTKKHVQFRASTKSINPEKSNVPNSNPFHAKLTTESKPNRGKTAETFLGSSTLEQVSSENIATDDCGKLSLGSSVKSLKTNTFLKNDSPPSHKETNFSKHHTDVKWSECNSLNNQKPQTTAKGNLFVKEANLLAPTSEQRSRSTSLTNLHRVSSDEMTNRSRKISLSSTLSLTPINEENRKKVVSLPIENYITHMKPALKNKLRRHSSAIYPRRLSQSFTISSQKPYKHTANDTIEEEVNSKNKPTFEKYYSVQLKLSDDMAKHYHFESKMSSSKRRSNSQSSDNKGFNSSISSTQNDLTNSKNASSSAVKNKVSQTPCKSTSMTSETYKTAYKSNSLELSQTDLAPSALNVTITTSTVPTMSNLAYINSSWNHAVNEKSPNSNHLLHRPKSMGSLTTKFLTPEQLVIRESVEKVQRWIRTLPKHFDAIQNVLPPVQQDY